MAMSGILERLARGLNRVPKKTSLLEKILCFSPDSIIAVHRDNFAVDHDHVVSLTVEPGGYDRADIVLVTSDMKVEMSASLSTIQGIGRVEAVLGRKLSFRL